MDLLNKQVGNTYGKYFISLFNPPRLLFPEKKNHLQILCLIRVTQLTALSPSKHGTYFSGVILHCVMFLMKLVSRRWLRHHPPQAAPDNPLWFWCLFSLSTKQSCCAPHNGFSAYSDFFQGHLEDIFSSFWWRLCSKARDWRAVDKGLKTLNLFTC